MMEEAINVIASVAGRRRPKVNQSRAARATLDCRVTSLLAMTKVTA